MWLHVVSVQLLVCLSFLTQLSASTSTPGVAHVKEQRQTPIPVLNLKADFPDLKDSDNFRFEPATSSEVRQYFAVDANTGLIATTHTVIDRELLNSSATDAFKFRVQSRPGPKHTTVTIYVDDINDNAPSFIQVDPQNATISENVAIGKLISSPSAYDPDIGNNTLQSYSGVITSGNEDGHFVLRQDKVGTHRLKLELEVVKPLDRETQQYYQFNITVSDDGNPSLSSWILFNLTVSDVNDNAPFFVTTRFDIKVSENIQPNEVLVTVQGVDLDENSQLVYSIMSVTPQNYNGMKSLHMFAVDSSNGSIRLLKSLDYEYELDRKLEIAVRVFDGSFSDTAILHLYVTNANDNPPMLFRIQSPIDVGEDFPLGGAITNVYAEDKDSATDKQLEYSITGGMGYFNISRLPFFGASITLAKRLDRETIDKFDFTVTVLDDGTPPLTANQSLTIIVTDINDNSPTFVKQQYTKTVAEDVRVGSIIASVSATDLDDGSNGNVNYSIPNNQRQSHWFAVDAAGIVTTAQKLDRETASVVYLVVTAEDNGNPSLATNTTVVVTLTDINDNSPVFSELQYNITVPENASQGVIVAVLSASDPDEGTFGKVTYAFASGIVQSEFLLDSTSGELELNTTLDREKDAIYVLVVDAVDGGKRVSSVNVIIIVTDINDNHPLFYPQHYDCVVYENTSVGHHCVSMTASDEDENQAITYEIVSGNEDGDFTLDQQSGKLVTAKALDYEHRRSYMLVISATDEGGLVSMTDATVNVTVANVLDKPPLFDNTSYAFAVNETDNAGTVVGWVSAITQDAGTKNGQLSYSITGGDPHSKFEIDYVSGKISLKKEVDRESKSFYQLQVTAHCCGLAPLIAVVDVNVTVLDANDNAPKFQVSNKDSLQVDENLPIGYVVANLAASDEDEGVNAEIYYHLTEETSGLFVISNSTGILYVKQPLDYETLNRTSIVVSAYDRGSPQQSSSVSLIIMVIDVNDHRPEFAASMYKASLLENISLTETAFHVSSSDQDSGSNSEIIYSLDGDRELPFDIVATGDVLVIRQLDAERTDSYDFRIIARDNGRPSLNATVPVHVDVLDVNDNSPVFDPRVNLTFSVWEDVRLGYIVGQVAALDKDKGLNGEVTYSFSRQVSAFQVDASNGTIAVAGSIDRELKSLYSLTVVASDRGVIRHTSTAVIQIHILDLNDNAPVFDDQLKSVFSVKENTPVNESFDVVKASDDDVGRNGDVTYVIKSGNERGDLSIDNKVGSLSIAKSLDRETVSSYDLVIEAFDNGDPRKSAVKHIKVNVVDVNDNRPVFMNSSGVRVTTQEDVTVDSELVHLVATDRDSGENGVVLFSIEHGNLHSSFHIDSSSGILRNRKLLDYELTKTYNLTIKAMDNATDYALDSRIVVYIDLTDVNDNTPVFHPSSFAKAVYEDIPSFASILKVTATDRDHGANGEIRYSISERIPTSQQFTFFTIDAVSGIVRTQRPLHHGITSYDLIIMAEDQAQLLEDRRNTTAPLRITVQPTRCSTVSFITSNQWSVSEDAPTNQPLHVVAARANNAPDCVVGTQKFVYSLDHGNEGNSFQLDYVTGELKLVKSLDREVRDDYNLSIRAYGEGAPPPIGAQNFHVIVTDVNDNSPIFDSASYAVDVDEGATEGIKVLKVYAEDYDLGSNGDVTYTISAGNQFGFFTIHNKTGWIQLASLFTPPRGQTVFILTVRAEDKAQQPKWTTVEVVVSVHARLAPPVFLLSSYVFSVLENNPDHAVIGFVQAVDTSHRQVHYEILGNNLFVIGNSSGSIIVTRPLDYELEQEFSFTVRASLAINSSLATTIVVKVQVVDANDNSPTFESAPYSVLVSEDAAVGLPVFHVKANDDDSGLYGTIIYSLEGSDGSFTVNSSSGWITVAAPLDREKTSTYVFQVRASESTSENPQSTFALVQITLQDVNDNSPIFTQSSYRVNVSGQVHPHTKVLHMVAMDADAGLNGDVMYSFVDRQQAFLLDQQTGLITVSMSGLLAGHLYQLTVAATDGGIKPRVTRQLAEVRAIDPSVQQLPPRFLQATVRLSIDENTAAGFQLATIEAVSDRAGTNMKYSLFSGNQGDKFNIRTSGMVGLLTLTKSLDVDTVDYYDLVVRADDNGSPSLYSDMHVYVNVTPVRGDIAEFINPRIGHVYENQPVNTSLMNITACNPFSTSCKSDMFQYYLATDGDSTAFVIDQKTGELKTAKLIDAEQKQSYDVVVSAVDLSKSSQRGTATIQITVLDQNDNKPYFLPLSNVSVPESTKEGSVITTLNAIDRDVSHRLSFSLTASTDNKFVVDATNGHVTVQHALDYETTELYEVRVAVYDGYHSEQAKFYVRVLDSNDNPPQFSLLNYQSSVDERSLPGTIVANVTATDRDSGSNGEIWYALSDSYNYLFQVNSQTGIVSCNKTVFYQYGSRDFYDLKVIAYDRGTPMLSSETTVTVRIIDLNDNAPQFDQILFLVEVPENAPQGSTVGAVKAIDNDQGVNGELNYQAGAGNATKFFIIEAKTGSIVVVRQGFVLNEMYHLGVKAFDSGTHPGVLESTSQVHLVIIHKQPVKFDKKVYNVTLEEGGTPGSFVVKVLAYAGSPEFSIPLEYQIARGENSAKFLIDQATGRIQTRTTLDYFDAFQYEITVIASDNSSPASTATTTVLVNIIDINNNRPSFDKLVYTATIPENSPDLTITTVSASDRDSPVNSKIRFSLLESHDSRMFSIDAVTGDITAHESLDYEKRQQYSFTVEAIDSGEPPLSSTAQVNVTVEGVNEMTPQFEQIAYKITIEAGTPFNKSIGEVTATDGDYGSDGEVQYEFTLPSDQVAIDRYSGLIKYIGQNEKRSASSRVTRAARNNLTVVAKDGGSPQLTGTASVFVYDASTGVIEELPVRSSSQTIIIVCAVVAILLVLMCIVILIVLLLRKRRRKTLDITTGKKPTIKKPITLYATNNPAVSQERYRQPEQWQHQPQQEMTVYKSNERAIDVVGLNNEISKSNSSLLASGRFQSQDRLLTASRSPQNSSNSSVADLSPDDKVILPSASGSSAVSMLPKKAYSPSQSRTESDVRTNSDAGSVRSGARPDMDLKQIWRDLQNMGLNDGQESTYEFNIQGGGEADGGIDVGNLLNTKLAEADAEEFDAFIDGTRPFSYEGASDSVTVSAGGSIASTGYAEDDLMSNPYTPHYHRPWLSEINRTRPPKQPPPGAAPVRPGSSFPSQQGRPMQIRQPVTNHHTRKPGAPPLSTRNRLKGMKNNGLSPCISPGVSMSTSLATTPEATPSAGNLSPIISPTLSPSERTESRGSSSSMSPTHSSVSEVDALDR